MKAFSLLLSLIAASAAAQEAAISASVNKTVVALNEQIVLTVTIAGNTANLPGPQLPSLPNFNVYGSGTSHSMQMINGQVASSQIHTYVLTPRFVGKAVIPPIYADINGQRKATSPIEIQVVRTAQQAGSIPQPPGQPQPPAQPQQAAGPAVFVTASVDKAKAFVNEQVTLTVRFYAAVPLTGGIQYSAPNLAGFISEDLPPERQGAVTMKGRNYRYSELKTALFPTQPGRLTISPATIRCNIPDNNPNLDPFSHDFFERFFNQGLAKTVEVRTDPVTIDVLPLPAEGKLAGFSGAVGRFKISAAVDNDKPKAGGAVTLSLTVEGAGDLKALSAPAIPANPSIRVYDTVSSVSMNKMHDVVQGSKVFKTVIVPRASGELKIPSIAYSYFDPGSRSYKETRTDPLSLQVAPADPGQAPVGFVSGQAPGVSALGEDIRHIMLGERSRPVSAALSALAALGWLNLAPLTLLAGAVSRSVYQERLSLDPAGARFRAALGAARGKIRQAEAQLASDSRKAAGLLSDALAGFLADKLGLPAATLSLRDAIERLRTRGLAGQALDELKAVWEGLEILRFAGAGDATAEAAALITRVRSLLESLEEAIDR